MWISKKKHTEELYQAARKQHDLQHELEQSDKLWTLERDVKKLKKKLLKLEGMIKNGY
jgi:hypothetical protein